MKQWTYKALLEIAYKYGGYGVNMAHLEMLLDECSPETPDTIAVKIIRAVIANECEPESMTAEQKKIMNTYNKRSGIKLTHYK